MLRANRNLWVPLRSHVCWNQILQCIWWNKAYLLHVCKALSFLETARISIITGFVCSPTTIHLVLFCVRRALDTKVTQEQTISLIAEKLMLVATRVTISALHIWSVVWVTMLFFEKNCDGMKSRGRKHSVITRSVANTWQPVNTHHPSQDYKYLSAGGVFLLTQN